MNHVGTITVGVGGTIVTFTLHDAVGLMAGALTCVWMAISIWDRFKKRP